MSAFIRNEDPVYAFVMVPDGWASEHYGNVPERCSFTVQNVGPLSFIMEGNSARKFGIAFDGQIPETFIDHYIGAHPANLLDGFAQMCKPEACQWMNRSRIKSIVNHMGSVLVELEPA